MISTKDLDRLEKILWNARGHDVDSDRELRDAYGIIFAEQRERKRHGESDDDEEIVNLSSFVPMLDDSSLLSGGV